MQASKPASKRLKIGTTRCRIHPILSLIVKTIGRCQGRPPRRRRLVRATGRWRRLVPGAPLSGWSPPHRHRLRPPLDRPELGCPPTAVPPGRRNHLDVASPCPAFNGIVRASNPLGFSGSAIKSCAAVGANASINGPCRSSTPGGGRGPQPVADIETLPRRGCASPRRLRR